MGPVVYGPTGPGPSCPIVLQIPAGGTHYNLDEPRFAMLKDAAHRSVPLMIAADLGAIAYNWSLVGSGLAVDPAMTAFGATGTFQGGAIYANTRLDQPEMAPQDARGLVVAPLNGTSGMMRLWKTG